MDVTNHISITRDAYRYVDGGAQRRLVGTLTAASIISMTEAMAVKEG